MVLVNSRLLLVVLVCGGLLVSGCTEKAQALKVGVSQFEAESIAAVDAIDSMRKQEIAPLERSAAKATREFVDNVLGLSPGTAVDDGNLGILLDTYTVTPSPRVEQSWSQFIGNLRAQYTTFARIFDELDRASFTARNTVKEAEPFIEKLTAQLAYFAREIEKNPPRLIQQRSALLASLADIKNGSAPTADKRRQIAQWRDEWLALMAAEAELKRVTVEKCLKAATIGIGIREQIQDYDKISIADISSALKQVFAIAGSITGQDYSQLQSRVADIISMIENDPVWNTAAQAALTEINARIAARR